jgi:hypothetical protein
MDQPLEVVAAGLEEVFAHPVAIGGSRLTFLAVDQ